MWLVELHRRVKFYSKILLYDRLLVPASMKLGSIKAALKTFLSGWSQHFFHDIAAAQNADERESGLRKNEDFSSLIFLSLSLSLSLSLAHLFTLTLSFLLTQAIIHTHVPMFTQIHIQTFIRQLDQAHTRLLDYSHAHAHTHTHAHMHTHAHTRTLLNVTCGIIVKRKPLEGLIVLAGRHQVRIFLLCVVMPSASSPV